MTEPSRKNEESPKISDFLKTSLIDELSYFSKRHFL